MSFLGLSGKTFLVLGVANKKSIAYHVASLLIEQGATVVCGVRTKERCDEVRELLPTSDVHACDLSDDAEITAIVPKAMRPIQ